MLLNILQYAGQSPQQRIYLPKMSTAMRMRNLGRRFHGLHEKWCMPCVVRVRIGSSKKRDNDSECMTER